MFKPRKYNRLLSAVNQTLSVKVNNCLQSGQAWLLPAHCVLCGDVGEQGRDLCAACHGDLPAAGPACQQCALPLPVVGLCGRCQRRPRPFAAAAAAFHYRPPMDTLLQRLKFGGDIRLARLLGELMGEVLLERGLPPAAEILVPVPLHPSRLRQRGFNQALELARPLARRLGLPLDVRGVERLRATAPQSDLPAKQRRRNVKGAFRVMPVLAGRHVLLVDDVMTTGQTVSELAATLRRAGALSVTVWVCARVVL